MAWDEGVELVRHCYEQGVNLFDTAPLYGKGRSERCLGQALKAVREEVLIVSKCGISWQSSGRIDHHNHPDICRKMLEQSLRDLQTDYIDLYMIHHPDPKVDIRRPMEVLAEAQTQGKCRFIGLCNVGPEDLVQAGEVAKIDVVENECNFFHHQRVKDILPHLEQRGIGLIGWGTLHKGILAGTDISPRLYDTCDVRSWAKWWRGDPGIERERTWVREHLLLALAELGIAPVTFALQYALHFESLACALCGIRCHQHLQQLLAGMEQAIAPAIWGQLLESYPHA